MFRATRILVPLLGVAAFTLAGCTTSSDAEVDQITLAPRPAGSVVRSAEARDGDVERGPSAELVLSVPLSLDATCRAVVGGYQRAGYVLEEYGEGRIPVPDGDAWCTQQQADPVAPGDVAAYIVVAFPPGGSRKYPDDGFSAVITADDRADPDRPTSTQVRLSAR